MIVPKPGSYILIRFTEQGAECFWGGETDRESMELQAWLKENLTGGRLAGLTGGVLTAPGPALPGDLPSGQDRK